MCGIVGIVGTEPVSERLMEGLRRLEYRGYDSAGIATLVDGEIDTRKTKGKLSVLADLVAAQPIKGLTGIGHTRWATHGEANVQNAHPHATPHVALVHNGIIENFRALRAELVAGGVVLCTDTDTEVIVHLIDAGLADGLDPVQATQEALKQLRGAFGLAILFAGEEDLLIGARQGSPLAVGHGNGEMYLASDALALAQLTSRITYLDEGDMAVLNREALQILDREGEPVEREERHIALSASLVDKGEYRHFMRKEIAEQPAVVAETIGTYLEPLRDEIRFPDMALALNQIDEVNLVACGTASFGARVGAYWIEELARIPASAEIASEFRYKNPVLSDLGLTIPISQSGETADTLAALRHAKAGGHAIAAIINVPESTMTRDASTVFPTRAGPEIGVASTKAFTCQLSVLALFALALGRANKEIDDRRFAGLIDAMRSVPGHLATLMDQDAHIARIGHDISHATDALFLARGNLYPIGIEGSHKLKEISYIHAEGYAAGEPKHGAIALVDENVPVIVLAPSNQLYDKTISNMQEMIARDAKVIMVSDAKGIAEHGDEVFASIEVPLADPFVAPILYTIPMQLLAYHTAVALGTDVDQPRNLAKSVTVE